MHEIPFVMGVVFGVSGFFFGWFKGTKHTKRLVADTETMKDKMAWVLETHTIMPRKATVPILNILRSELADSSEPLLTQLSEAKRIYEQLLSYHGQDALPKELRVPN